MSSNAGIRFIASTLSRLWARSWSCLVPVLVAIVLVTAGEAGANAGNPLILGASNSAGTSGTSVSTASTKTAFSIAQGGTGTGLNVSAGSTGGTSLTANEGNPNRFGVVVQNQGSAGNGGALRAIGGNNAGVVARTKNSAGFALSAANNASAGGAGAAIEADGKQNSGLSASTANGSSEAVSGANQAAGTGVQGTAPGGTGSIGVKGTSGGTGDGSFGVYSTTDLGVGGSLVCTKCVSNGDLGDGSVGTSQVADGSVTPSKLSFDAATRTDLNAHVGRPGFSAVESSNSSLSSGIHTSMTIGSDGLGIIVSHGTSVFGGSVLLFDHCSNLACSTGDAGGLLDGSFTSGDVGDYPSVAIGSDGLPIISYYDATNGNLKVAHCHSVNCFGGADITTIDSSSDDVGRYTSLAIGTDGLAFISYYDATTGNLLGAHCSNVSCSSATLTTIDGSSDDVGRNSSVTIGADGLPVVSYYDATTGSLMAAHCTFNSACTSANRFFPPASRSMVDSGGVGLASSIVLGSDGFPLISYSTGNGNGGNLKVAHCSNASCSSATISTLDGSTSDLVAQSTAINVGSDGFGVISYYDFTKGTLKVAHCSSITCSSATVITLDSGGNLGQDSSLTIAPDGFPLISYLDFSNTTLKVAHCSNVFCVPNFRRR